MATSIHQETRIKAPARRIYDVLLSSREHEAFTKGGGTRIDPKEGGPFYCHGRYIHGRTIELKPGRRIVQAWHFKGWPPGVYSMVKFELKKARGGTRLVLDQTGIPPKHVGHLTSGWKARYWKPLKAYLEKRR